MGQFDFFLVFVVSVVAVFIADVTTSLSCGECVCVTTNTNARSGVGPSGPVIVLIYYGEYAIATGDSLTADGCEWYQVTYRDQIIWIAVQYISRASSLLPSCWLRSLVPCSSYPSRGSCTSSVRQLACDLLNNSGRNLTLATVHPSCSGDNAFARNNLRDTCDGGQAARSSYTCSECRNPGAPGGSVCIAESVLRYLALLVSRGPVKVNEITGACHSCHSKHYQGLAINLDDGPRDQEFVNTCNYLGGYGIDEGNHIHCHFYS